jgi:hypothetical protein
MRSQLLKLLSTESRLAQTAQNISNGGRTALLDLQTVLQTKISAIRNIKDREVAEQKLGTFRVQFGEASERFKGVVEQQVVLLRKRLEMKRQQQTVFIENIGLRAEQQLAYFELNDVGRHWRTRRSGYWGYMHDFQGRVANGIFPKVQELLGEQSELFARFSKDFEVFLKKLADEGAAISENMELGATMPFDVRSKLKDSLVRSLQSANELISSEELRITSLLEEFVSDEVSERINERRAKVSTIWGQGTTSGQSSEVREFYREVKALLQKALTDHLEERCKEFGEHLFREAESAPRDALNEIQTMLEQAGDNIRAAATALIADQKETAELQANSIYEELAGVLAECEAILNVPNEFVPLSAKAQPIKFITPDKVPSNSLEKYRPELRVDALGEDWFIRVQRDATASLNRYHLSDGATGWPYARMFEPKYLHGALSIAIIAPYLTAHHQIRNLNEFLLMITECTKPKEIIVVTGYAPADVVGHQDRALDNTAKDLFLNFGITLTVRREVNMHDRFVVFNHGVLFKLGRGLDIYKPSTGLAAHRAGSRRVRQTEIDVFVVPGHPLLSTK